MKLLVALRDGFKDLADSLDAYLQANKPPEVEVARVAELFPRDVRAALSFEGTADVTVIRPKHFLGAGEFTKILEIVKAHNGSYKSAGKGSHFRIPRNPK